MMITVVQALKRGFFVETVVQDASGSSSPGEALSAWCYKDAYGLGHRGEPCQW